jgi:adenylate cyclase class 2
MHIEIEAKLKVDSLARVVRRLRAVGAKLQRKSVHTDTYYDDGKKSFREADKALRLRRMRIGKKEKAALTIKGPRQKGRFKQRQEIQFGIDDVKSAKNFLESLGYKKAIVFQKKRQLWRAGGCEVALDELPLLGTFVEIEGPNEKKIAAVQKKLGLADVPHIPESYATLMERKLRQRKFSRKRK